jgi:hypothetical protein
MNCIRHIQVDKEKEKAKKANISTTVKPVPEFSINSKFLLDTEIAAYTLSIEIQVSPSHRDGGDDYGAAQCSYVCSY